MATNINARPTDTVHHGTRTTAVSGVTDNPRYPASVVMRSSRLRYCRDDS